MHHLLTFRGMALAAIAFGHLAAIPVQATVTFDFESTNPLSNSLVSGNRNYFAVTTEQARSGNQSIKFVEGGPEPFESFTYDMPIAMTSGTVSVWFYDARGLSAFQTNPFAAVYGGSIILEDANNPADFGAIEINELPYGGGRYYGSEGVVDRGVLGNKFDSISFPNRSVGWHQVQFHVTPTSSTIFVDGQPAARVGAPGSNSNLRLRIMNGSAGNGSATPFTPGLPPGYQPNWFTTAVPFTSAYSGSSVWVSYDDISFNAELPAVASHTQGFEIVSGTPEYDSAGFFMGPTPNDNPFMRQFVNQWDVTTTNTLVRSGNQAAYFRNAVPAFKSIVFDLSGAQPNTTATVWFYDTRGSNNPTFPIFDMGGAIMIENATDPSDFLAVEIWTATYPTSGDPTPGGPNYYLTRGRPTNPIGSLFSRKFGNRTIGWNRVDIFLTNTTSQISVNGISDSDNSAPVFGPGLNSGLRLRLMADSPTSGGFNNYTSINEVQVNYFQTLAPYVYYDDISLPIPQAGVVDWAIYE
jgi:hypothetical protein